MRFEITASGSSDYGDYATVRIYFEDESWIEVDAADAHSEIGPGRRDTPYSQGAKVTLHHANGSEEIAWDGFVMPAYYAKRLARGRG